MKRLVMLMTVVSTISAYAAGPSRLMQEKQARRAYELKMQEYREAHRLDEYNKFHQVGDLWVCTEGESVYITDITGPRDRMAIIGWNGEREKTKGRIVTKCPYIEDSSNTIKFVWVYTWDTRVSYSKIDDNIWVESIVIDKAE